MGVTELVRNVALVIDGVFAVIMVVTCLLSDDGATRSSSLVLTLFTILNLAALLV